MIRLLITGFFCLLLSATMAQPAVGEKVPDIVLKDLNGNVQKLSGFRGKMVLVDFWASWCAPCRKSNRELAPVYEKYKSKGFEIFGISLDQQVADWKKAVQADKIQWMQVSEVGGWDAPVALEWKIESLPASFLIDQNGTVLLVNPTKSQIEEQVKKLK